LESKADTAIGVPKAVGTKTNPKVIEVAAGKVYDGGWYRFDRGSGACKGQTEGGMFIGLQLK
jgi:hypothetical protein